MQKDLEATKREAYTLLQENINAFRELNRRPAFLNIGQDTDVDQLIGNQVKWHKPYHLKFNVSKPQRAIRRERGDT